MAMHSVRCDRMLVVVLAGAGAVFDRCRSGKAGTSTPRTAARC